jgi:hypothetical protein
MECATHHQFIADSARALTVELQRHAIKRLVLEPVVQRLHMTAQGSPSSGSIRKEWTCVAPRTAMMPGWPKKHAAAWFCKFRTD